MKEVKKKLGKTALIYNVINILSLIITIFCFLCVDKIKDSSSLILIIPCISILFSIIFSLSPLLEKDASLSHINFRIYQNINMSVSIVLCFMQFALLCLILSVQFNANIMICIAIGIMHMIIGNLMPKMKTGSFVSYAFPKLINNYQAWRHFSRTGGFIIFVEGLVIMILGGLYSSWYTYLFILGLIIIGLSILYIFAIFYGKKFKMENEQNAMED